MPPAGSSRTSRSCATSLLCKPHNRLGAVNEEELAAAFAPAFRSSSAARRTQSGNVIVGCMKNEAPYIVEWVAYHRAIGVDNFLIYTNGCEDGTSQMLDRSPGNGACCSIG